MPAIEYLLIGTTTADIVGDERVLGGTVSYAAPVARQFGHSVRILTSCADPEPLLDPLHDVADLHIIPAKNTTTFENTYTESGRKQIVHHVSTPLTVDMLPCEWQKSQLVHLAPLVNEVDTGFSGTFEDATVLLTPQGYMRQWGDDGVVYFKRFLDTEVLGLIDILVLSKQDIAGAPDLEYEFPKYANHVIVTDSERGGTYYHNGVAQPYDAFPVREVDPTGAGDVFAASLLASLPLLNYDIPMAIKVAARLAALAVTVRGAKIVLTTQDIHQALQEAQRQS